MSDRSGPVLRAVSTALSPVRRLFALGAVSAADAPRPLAKSTVAAVVAPFAAWLALAGGVAAVAGSGPARIAAGGWRIVAYRDVLVAAFAVALVVSVITAVALEARRRS